MTEKNEHQVDVAVIGGGAAGLQAALSLGRVRRRTLVVDGGEPRNAPAPALHNVLALDGTAPGEVLARGRAELAGYRVPVLDDRVVSAVPNGPGDFELTLAGGAVIKTRRLLLATGLVDELPEIPGLGERWGRDVIHCPYCHGWELRDRDLVVLGLNGFATHLALTLKPLGRTVTLVRHTAPELTVEQLELLSNAGVRLVEGRVAEILTDQDAVSGVRLVGGEVLTAQGVVLSPTVRPRLNGLEGLNLPVAEHPSGLGLHVPADPRGMSPVPGVFVAGNVTEPMATVAHALGSGVTAAANLNADLLHEEYSPQH